MDYCWLDEHLGGVVRSAFVVLHPDSNVMVAEKVDEERFGVQLLEPV